MKNGKTVYFCKRISEPGEDEQFSKPQAIVLRLGYLTIQPVSGYMDFQAYGEFVDITYRGIATPYEMWDGVFHEGDRFYLDKVPDGFLSEVEPELGWGYDANAKIIAVKPQNVAINLTIRNIVE